MGELLAAVYDPLVGPFDLLGFDEWRNWVASAARGQVLELGIGTGRNLPHYHFEDSRAAGALGVQALVAIDPDHASLRRACSRRNGSSNAISLYAARAEALPLADNSFDVVLGTLVFCTIGDPTRALQEAWRVLRPGGQLRLLEHVRVHSRLIGGMQDVVTPVWRRVAAGCHLNRDTASAVERAGFRVDAVRRHLGGLFIGIDAAKSGE